MILKHDKSIFYESMSEADTEKIASEIANDSRLGDIVCLDGELGSGKTFFVKSFAKAIGIKDYVSSPTFNIINEYEGKINVYHFDVYRIYDPDTREYKSRLMDYTNYEDYFYGNGICVIEWAKYIKDIIPDHAVWINISKDLTRSDNYRLIKIN